MLQANKRGDQKKETLKVATLLGIAPDDPLKGRIKAYAKAMVNQDTDVVKKIYLPALFNGSEMASLWQMLKTWVAKASPAIRKRWDEIQDMKGCQKGGQEPLEDGSLESGLGPQRRLARCGATIFP